MAAIYPLAGEVQGGQSTRLADHAGKVGLIHANAALGINLVQLVRALRPGVLLTHEPVAIVADHGEGLWHLGPRQPHTLARPGELGGIDWSVDEELKLPGVQLPNIEQEVFSFIGAGPVGEALHDCLVGDRMSDWVTW